MPFDYNSSKWRRLRAHILARDGYRCQLCKRYGRTTQAKIVHHKKDADQYPEFAYDPSNLISLCMMCHNKVHPEKATEARGRY